MCFDVGSLYLKCGLKGIEVGKFHLWTNQLFDRDLRKKVIMFACLGHVQVMEST